MARDEVSFLTVQAVLVHAIGCAANLIFLQIFVPKWLMLLSQYVISRPLPREFVFVRTISDLVRDYTFLVIPAVIALLWFDAKIYAHLLRSKSISQASLWSTLVSTTLMGSLLASIWAVTQFAR